MKLEPFHPLTFSVVSSVQTWQWSNARSKLSRIVGKSYLLETNQVAESYKYHGIDNI